MKRLWQSLAQRIGAKVRPMQIDEQHIENQLDAIMRDMQRCTVRGRFNVQEFRKNVAWHLHTERRIGRWEGCDVAKTILKPFIRTEAK